MISRGVPESSASRTAAITSASVVAVISRSAGPPTESLRRRHRHRRSLARVVFTSLHELERGSELPLVLILKNLLGRQQIGVTAPPRERHGEMALADARRRLQRQHARRAWILVGLGEGVVELIEQTRLLGARRRTGREKIPQRPAHASGGPPYSTGIE